ncbi:MAG: SIS domain-containing protein [Anaerolineaceae bacterium]|nr:SIS domain-containing protein [Anaerolineaceae bacterium]
MEFIDYVKEIPRLIKNFLSRKNQLISFYSQAASVKKFERIVIVGSGTSHTAALTVSPYIRRLTHKEIACFIPSDFLAREDLLLKTHATCYIFVSQGGDTKLVLNCLEKAKSAHAFCVSVTDNVNGRIPQASDFVVPMEVEGEPFLFRTAGFDMTCIVLTFFLLSILSENKAILEHAAQELGSSSEKLPGIISTASAWYCKHAKELAQTSHFIFIAEKDLLPLAQEADLKFMEMLPTFSRYFDLEESIHGPQNAFLPSMTFFLLAQNQQDQEKTVNLFNFLKQEVGAKAYIISNDVKAAAFQIPLENYLFAFLGYITFFQVLAYYLAKDRGRDLTKVTYPSLTHFIQKKFD